MQEYYRQEVNLCRWINIISIQRLSELFFHFNYEPKVFRNKWEVNLCY